MAKAEVASRGVSGAQKQYFKLTNQVPEEIWYWSALGSIIVSAILFFTGQRSWGLFVGQWPPTFMLFALFHKLLRPAHQQPGL